MPPSTSSSDSSASSSDGDGEERGSTSSDSTDDESEGDVNTTLWTCAAKGDVGSVRAALAEGADPNWAQCVMPRRARRRARRTVGFAVLS